MLQWLQVAGILHKELASGPVLWDQGTEAGTGLQRDICTCSYLYTPDFVQPSVCFRRVQDCPQNCLGDWDKDWGNRRKT